VAQGSESLLRSARERLKLWDISDEQIKKLDETLRASAHKNGREDLASR
jgi:hypothetical protein